MMSGILLMAMFAGCAPAHIKSAKYEGRYVLDTPGPNWTRVAPGSADKAWRHGQTTATIYFDSNCKARFEDGRLGDLMTHLTFGIVEGEPLREETLTLDGREALMRVYTGSLDGVAVQIGVVVTKKNECLYDGLYIAPPTQFDEGWNGFVSVLSGFETRRR